MQTAPLSTNELLNSRPRSHEHLRGMMWVSSLARLMDEGLAKREDPTGQAADDRLSLQHSLQLYSIFAETGDERYLGLAEDFLRYTLEAT